jgi:hypothetical protein
MSKLTDEFLSKVHAAMTQLQAEGHTVGDWLHAAFAKLRGDEQQLATEATADVHQVEADAKPVIAEAKADAEALAAEAKADVKDVTQQG